MSKWQQLKHRIQLANAYRWFLSLENDLARMEMTRMVKLKLNSKRKVRIQFKQFPLGSF